MNSVDFVEKYQQEMVVLMAIGYLQDPDCLHPTGKIWHTING